MFRKESWLHWIAFAVKPVWASGQSFRPAPHKKDKPSPARLSGGPAGPPVQLASFRCQFESNSFYDCSNNELTGRTNAGVCEKRLYRYVKRLFSHIKKSFFTYHLFCKTRLTCRMKRHTFLKKRNGTVPFFPSSLVFFVPCFCFF